MREEGTVVGISDGQVQVGMADASGCHRCGACSRIGARMVLQVPIDPVNPVAVGDHVVVDIPAEPGFGAVALVYVVPLLGLILGAGAGALLTHAFWPGSSYPNLAPILLSLAGLAAGFWVASSYDRRRRVGLNRNMRIVQRL